MKASQAPVPKTTASTCQTSNLPVIVSVANVAKSTAVRVVEPMRSLRWSNLSARTPPRRFIAMPGIARDRPRRPSWKAEPVRSKMSHIWVTMAIC